MDPEYGFHMSHERAVRRSQIITGIVPLAVEGGEAAPEEDRLSNAPLLGQ
jgi:hypothetical protein